MTPSLKLLPIISLIFFSLLLVGYNFSTHAGHAIQSHEKNRIVVVTAGRDEPLKMKSIKTRSVVIDAEKRFDAEEDWFKGLTIRLDNHSGKTVTFVEILITFWRTEDQVPGLPAGWPLKKGLDPFSTAQVLGVPPQADPVAPGREIEIVLSDTEYDEVRRFLRDVKFPDSIKKIELEVIKVGFNDGSAWNAGMMYRRRTPRRSTK